MLSLDEQVDVLRNVPDKSLIHPPHVPSTVSVGSRTDQGRESPMVIAAEHLAGGACVFREAPLIGCQLLENAGYALVCHRCFTFVGSVERQLANAGDHLDGCIAATGPTEARPLVAPLPTLPKSQNFPLPGIHLCRGWPACSDAYCSDDCSKLAWQEGHSLLCVAQPRVQNGSEREPLMEAFRDHAGLSSDTFKLGAQAVAWALLAAQADLEAKGRGLDDKKAAWDALQRAWAPFCVGEARPDWWDVAPPPPGSPPSDDMRLRAEVRETALEALELLKAALEERAPMLVARFPAALHPCSWAGLLGTLETRKTLLTVASPLPAWARAVQDGQGEGPQNAAALQNSRAVAGYGGLDAIATGDDEWMCVGMGFYPLQALVRHSCSPNATTAKRDDDTNGDAIIVATRAISAGDEVTLSYIDRHASLEERTQELQHRYGFTCFCDKCGIERLARTMSGR